MARAGDDLLLHSIVLSLCIYPALFLGITQAPTLARGHGRGGWSGWP